MKIELDYAFTQEVREKIWQTREKWGKEFHRSDLVYCPLKAYCRLRGIEAKPRAKVVENWIVGEIAHRLVQRAFELVEVEKEFQGAQVHFDIIHRGLPLEVKTTITSILNKEHIPQEYLDQLIYGLVFNQSKEGLLMTFDIVNKVLLVWRIRISNRELEEYTRKFISQRRRILEAAKKGDPSMLEPKWNECKTCPYNYEGGCPRRR